jgi:hypothetical protein
MLPYVKSIVVAINLKNMFPCLNETMPHPTVTPTHTLKTLLSQIVTNEIENYALQPLRRFMQTSNVHNRRLMNFSPRFTKSSLRNILTSENNVQNAITLIRAYLPILHLKMKFTINTHLQSPKISIKITAQGLRRTRKRHKPQPLPSTLANSQSTHQTLKNPTLLPSVDTFALFHVTSKFKVKNLRRQFLDRVETPLVAAKQKKGKFAADIST